VLAGMYERCLPGQLLSGRGGWCERSFLWGLQMLRLLWLLQLLVRANKKSLCAVYSLLNMHCDTGGYHSLRRPSGQTSWFTAVRGASVYAGVEL